MFVMVTATINANVKLELHSDKSRKTFLLCVRSVKDFTYLLGQQIFVIINAL